MQGSWLLCRRRFVHCKMSGFRCETIVFTAEHMLRFSRALFPMQGIDTPEFVNYFCSSLLGFDFLPTVYDYIFEPDWYLD